MELSLVIFEKQTNAYSKSTIETVEEYVKNVQSW